MTELRAQQSTEIAWKPDWPQARESFKRRCNGRYLVGYPDLIENLDTLAQLRGTQTIMMDLLERVGWPET